MKTPAHELDQFNTTIHAADVLNTAHVSKNQPEAQWRAVPL
jgi:hypothetical protein